jgi:hypothetical protein
MTQTPEEVLSQAKANAQPNANTSKPKKKVDQKGIERSLAIVAETQYQNGVALTRKVGEQSFLKGIEDELDSMIEAGNMDDDQLSAIATKFQNVASKRLADRSPLFLPSSAWLEEDDDEGDLDD